MARLIWTLQDEVVVSDRALVPLRRKVVDAALAPQFVRCTDTTSVLLIEVIVVKRGIMQVSFKLVTIVRLE